MAEAPERRGLKLSEYAARILRWSRPYRPKRCSMCAGKLPEAPLLLFSQDGESSAAICEKCTPLAFVSTKEER